MSATSRSHISVLRASDVLTIDIFVVGRALERARFASEEQRTSPADGVEQADRGHCRQVNPLLPIVGPIQPRAQAERAKIEAQIADTVPCPSRERPFSLRWRRGEVRAGGRLG